MYVQALLLKMAQTTGEISEAMLTYIASIPERDILGIGKASATQALNIGFKNRSFAEGTPLLLRCCVAMDDKEGTATAQQFVDGVSRLLYAAADVDGDMSGNELNFITSYAGGLRTFLMTRAAGRHSGHARGRRGASTYSERTRRRTTQPRKNRRTTRRRTRRKKHSIR